MRRPLFLTAVLLVIVIGGSWPAWAKGRESLVTIVHGLPQFTADIYVDGELLLSGFRPEEATDPLPLPAGTYQVQIREVGAAADSPPVLEADLKVPGGRNLSVIAHLDGSGEPTVSVFDNRLGKVPPGRSRLSLRHQAEAAPVELVVDGDPVLSGVRSGEEDAMVIPAATHDVQVVAGDGEVLVSRGSLKLQEGSAYFVYLIGSASDNTLDLMVQRAAGLESPPSGVDTGGGGLAPHPEASLWPVVMLVAVALGLAVAGRMVPQRTP
jgi:Domain of unknown function (DUF4397)